MLCVNGKVDEYGQNHLLTFKEISSRRMRELRLGSFIVIVVLNVDKLRKLVLLNVEL
jgi:translation initiation factor 2 alpha subunit (eIF-2alpha)